MDEFGRKQTIVASAVSRHETFFSCVQAACYIVCFYGVEIANAQRNVRTTQKRWQKVLTCTLQPLRFCLQSVRVEFLRLAVQTNMCDDSCWESLPPDVLPNFNQNTPKKKIPGNVNMGAGFNPLDSFFPYDPCLLRMLHQPVENYYRVWRGVPGLDDVAEVEVEVENEVVLDESRIVNEESMLEMSMMGGDVSMAGCIGDEEGDVMVRSRGSSVCSDSGSESGESRSLSSSMHVRQLDGMDVCMVVSMTETESLGIGLLAEKEREMEKHRERGRGLDSRAQSMVSDCSLEDDRSHSISLSPHGHSHSHGIGHNVHDVHSPVFRALSNSSLPHVPSFTQFTSLMGGNNNINNLRDLGDTMDEGPYKGVSGANGVVHLADGGWPVPERRPRQYSVGSTGSW